MSDRAANSDDVRIGQRVRQAREAMAIRVTAADLGAVLGITYQQMCKFEAGLSALKARQLHAIAKRLGKPVEWFLDKR